MESAGSEGLIAALGVGSTVDDAFYLRPTDGTSAHSTGFDGDVERGIGEILASEHLRCSSDGLYLRVSCDIGEGLSEVVSTTDDTVVGDDDAADRDLIIALRLMRFV